MTSAPHSIQLFAPFYRKAKILRAIGECLDKGWTGLGWRTVEFEQAWCKYTGLRHAHMTNSATAGLHLALRLLREQGGWQDGDEIISTPLTFVSTNHVILYERLTPRFADVDQYLCMNPDALMRRISERTKAVIFVGLGGNTGQLEKVADICRNRGIALILDAAHMAGTRLNGRHVGAEADVAVFSFQAVKNLPTCDAGMVCFADGALDHRVRQWSWLGIDKDTYARTTGDGEGYRWRYDVPNPGFKYHGNSVTASMGLVGLRYLDADNARRRQIARLYADELIAVPGCEVVRTAPGCLSSQHLFQVLIENRDAVMAALNRQDIFPGVHYETNESYRMYASAGACPMAKAGAERLMSLPLHLRMTDDDARRVAGALIEAVQA